MEQKLLHVICVCVCIYNRCTANIYAPLFYRGPVFHRTGPTVVPNLPSLPGPPTAPRPPAPWSSPRPSRPCAGGERQHRQGGRRSLRSEHVIHFSTFFFPEAVMTKQKTLYLFVYNKVVFFHACLGSVGRDGLYTCCFSFCPFSPDLLFHTTCSLARSTRRCWLPTRR